MKMTYETLAFEIIGKTIKSVEQIDNSGDEIIFTFEDDSQYRMYHEQDCCESVYIDDIEGDLQELVGYPLLLAEEATNGLDDTDEGCSESCTWTFYKFRNVSTTVVIKWLGTSNGYYSESVSFEKIN